MNQTPIQNLSIQKTTSLNRLPISETVLEQAIGLSLLGDYNTQLAEVAQSMQTTITDKKRIGSEVTFLQTLATQTPEKRFGETVLPLSTEEKVTLTQLYPETRLVEDQGKSFIPQQSLEALISRKQQEMAQLNSNSEMTALQIQSLTDQRKNAITLLSNLMASRNETLMGIIRNLKN